MVSIMLSCANPLRLLAVLVLVSGCRGEDVDFGFRIDNINLYPGPRALNVGFAQQLEFSWESRNALQHGVPLVISVSMEIRDSESLTLLATEQQLYEIRYLPLSQRYELLDASSKAVRNFPRLRHVVNALSSLNLRFDTGPLAPGDYEFRARVRLEQSRLPAPMQLPILISGKWRHDSDWSSWPFRISV